MPSSSLFLRSSTTLVTVLSLFSTSVSAAPGTYYALDTEYAGASLVDGFNFQDTADLSHGFVTYVNKPTALSSGLVTFDGGSVQLRVDSVNSYDGNANYWLVNGVGRPSVRMETAAQWTHGLFIADIKHMPTTRTSNGCGTWPAFWTLGDGTWPLNGEIDIIEGANNQGSNLVAAHTGNTCVVSQNPFEMTGTSNGNDCRFDIPTGSNGAGCAAFDPRPSSYGPDFNTIGGGVYAMEWKSESIKVWFFPRGTIPSDIQAGTPDPSQWGLPASIFNGPNCDIDANFANHRIVFDTTFCGDFGDATWSTGGCAAITGQQKCSVYVGDNPQEFVDAYWDINYVRVYQSQPVVATTTTTSTTSTTSATTTTTTSTLLATTTTTSDYITSTSAASTLSSTTTSAAASSTTTAVTDDPVGGSTTTATSAAFTTPEDVTTSTTSSFFFTPGPIITTTSYQTFVPYPNTTITTTSAATVDPIDGATTTTTPGFTVGPIDGETTTTSSLTVGPIDATTSTTSLNPWGPWTSTTTSAAYATTSTFVWDDWLSNALSSISSTSAWEDWPTTSTSPVVPSTTTDATTWNDWTDVTITLTKTWAEPCASGYTTKTTTVVTTHCGCTETPVPTIPVTVTTITPSAGWSFTKPVVVTIPVSVATLTVPAIATSTAPASTKGSHGHGSGKGAASSAPAPAAASSSSAGGEASWSWAAPAPSGSVATTLTGAPAIESPSAATEVAPVTTIKTTLTVEPVKWSATPVAPQAPSGTGTSTHPWVATYTGAAGRVDSSVLALLGAGVLALGVVAL